MSANETAEQAAVYAQEIMRQQATIKDLLEVLQWIEQASLIDADEKHLALVALSSIRAIARSTLQFNKAG